MKRKGEKVNGIKIPFTPGTSNAISCGLDFESPLLRHVRRLKASRADQKGVLRLGGQGDI